mgnify:CR=1 FL=1
MPLSCNNFIEGLSITNFSFIIGQQGHGMGTSLQNTVQSGESYNQLQRQLAELQKQLLIVKAEKDEAIKLKEEVNAITKVLIIWEVRWYEGLLKSVET